MVCIAADGSVVALGSVEAFIAVGQVIHQLEVFVGVSVFGWIVVRAGGEKVELVGEVNQVGVIFSTIVCGFPVGVTLTDSDSHIVCRHDKCIFCDCFAIDKISFLVARGRSAVQASFKGDVLTRFPIICSLVGNHRLV